MLPNITYRFAQYPTLEVIHPRNTLGQIIAAHPANQACDAAKLFIRLSATYIIAHFILDRRLAQSVNKITPVSGTYRIATPPLLTAPAQPLMLPAPIQPIALLPARAVSHLAEYLSNEGEPTHADKTLGHSGNWGYRPLSVAEIGRRAHLLGEDVTPNWYDVPQLRQRYLDALSHADTTEADAEKLLGKPAREFSTCQQATHAFSHAWLKASKAYHGPDDKRHWYNDTRWARRRWDHAYTDLGLTEAQATELLGKPAYEFEFPDEAIACLRGTYRQSPIKQAHDEAEIAASTRALQAKRAALVRQ